MQQSLSFSLMRSLDRSKYTLVAKLIAQLGVDIIFECARQFSSLIIIGCQDARAMQIHMRLQPIFPSRRVVSSGAFTMTPICMRRSVREPVGLKISFVCLSFVRARVQRESPRQTRRSGGDGLLVSRLFSPLRQFRQPASGLLCIGRPSFAQLTTLRLMAA